MSETEPAPASPTAPVSATAPVSPTATATEPTNDSPPEKAHTTLSHRLLAWALSPKPVALLVILFVYFAFDLNKLDPVALLEDTFTSDDGMQHRVAISVGSPTIHTRERLLNDRFEQLAWLDHRLKDTDSRVTTAPSADPAKAETSPEKPTTLSDGNKFAFNRYQSSDIRYGGGTDDQRERFEVEIGYRDMIRAERARTMLDDRHDIDENTLDLLSFDASVLPSENARGSAAIEVTLTRNAQDLRGGAGSPEGDKMERANAQEVLNAQDDMDMFATYAGWLEKVRELENNNLNSIKQALVGKDDIDPSYEITLRVADCVEYLKAEWKDSRSALEKACRFAAVGTTPSDQEAVRNDAEAPLEGQLDRAKAAIIWIDGIRDRLVPIIKNVNPTNFLLDLNLPPHRDRVPRTEDQPVFRDVDDLISECSVRPPNANIPLRYSKAANTPPLPADSVLFECSSITKNSALLALFKIFVLTREHKAIVVDELVQEIPREENVARSKTLTCLAASLLEDGLVHATTERPRNHGAALSEFFNIKVATDYAGCSVDVQPKVTALRCYRPDGKACSDGLSHRPVDEEGEQRLTKEKETLTKLKELLEEQGYSQRRGDRPTRAYGYSLAPRLSQNVEIMSNRDTGASAMMGGGGGECWSTPGPHAS